MTPEILTSCPACNAPEINFSTNVPDYYFSKEVFEVWECKNCTLKFTQNRPDPNAIGKYYDSANYASHDSDSKKSLFLSVYNLARDYMLGLKFRLLRDFKPERHKSLDYGTGEGFYTEFLLRKGLDATGIEPSEVARANFKKRTGHSLLASLEELPDNVVFQSISLWHVLEHIHTLKATMQSLVRQLDKTGVMIIAVPNQASKDREAFGEAWAAWDVPRHLYHWNYHSLEKFMNSFGLENVHTGQLPLDPFYIGLISAKYANQSPVAGLTKAVQSFYHGKTNKAEGSTLLTVWMKK